MAITAEHGTMTAQRSAGASRRNGTPRSAGSSALPPYQQTRWFAAGYLKASRNRLHLGRIRCSTCRGDRCRAGPSGSTRGVATVDSPMSTDGRLFTTASMPGASKLDSGDR